MTETEKKSLRMFMCPDCKRVFSIEDDEEVSDETLKKILMTDPLKFEKRTKDAVIDQLLLVILHYMDICGTLSDAADYAVQMILERNDLSQELKSEISGMVGSRLSHIEEFTDMVLKAYPCLAEDEKE